MSIRNRVNTRARNVNNADQCEAEIQRLQGIRSSISEGLVDTKAMLNAERDVENGSTNRAYVNSGGRAIQLDNKEKFMNFVSVLNEITDLGEFKGFINLPKAAVLAISDHISKIEKSNNKIYDTLDDLDRSIQEVENQLIRFEAIAEAQQQAPETPVAQAEPTVKMQAIMVPATVDNDTLTELLNTYGTVTLAGRTFLQVPPNDVEMVNQIINAPAPTEVQTAQA